MRGNDSAAPSYRPSRSHGAPWSVDWRRHQTATGPWQHHPVLPDLLLGAAFAVACLASVLYNRRRRARGLHALDLAAVILPAALATLLLLATVG
jgi:hypothetical protein